MAVYRALGSLEPIIYFEDRDGQIMLPPTTEDARWLYQSKYSKEGWEWKEAGTLAEVDVLQKRLVAEERRRDEATAERDDRAGVVKWRAVGDALRERMISSSTSPYERDFIAAYLQVREDRRERHRQRWLERTSYLWAANMDSGTKPTDRMKSEPGDRWERGI
jgi:hypothetical protein